MRRALVVPGLAVALVLVAAELAVGAFTAHRSNPQDFVAASRADPAGRVSRRAVTDQRRRCHQQPDPAAG